MTNIKLLFILLPLLTAALSGVACTLTAQNAVINAMPLPEQTQTASPTPALKVCHVKTGIETGRLNLRTCGGTNCPIADILHEGESLTQTDTEVTNDWLEVKTTVGVTGWANSNYLDCEVTK